MSKREYLMILHAVRPAPPAGAPPRSIYVDLARQVLYEIRGGRVANTYPVSTGGGYTYLNEAGAPHVAKTPTGRFVIESKVAGWQHSYLGWMYYPSYFHDGYAIHGDSYVPPVPVSHGCIRIPDWLAVGFWKRNPIGTPVIVRRSLPAPPSA